MSDAAEAKAVAWPEISISLKHPIEHMGTTVTRLTLREPDVEALERIETLGLVAGKNPTVAQTRGIIAALSGVAGDADGLIKRLHKDDFAALAGHLVPLLAGDAAPSLTLPN